MENQKYTREEIEDGKSAAILAYIPFFCFVPLFRWKDNNFAYSHARQGLALFVIELIAVFLLIPGMAVLLVKVVLTVAVVLALIGIAFVMQDKEWKIPYLGDWIERKVDERLNRDRDNLS